MKFYPGLTLFSNYKRYLPVSRFFSNRIPDQTIKISVDNLNHAMNLCEKLGAFVDFGAGNGRFCAPLIREFSQGYGVDVEQDAGLHDLAKKHKNFKAIISFDWAKKINKKVDFFIMIDVFEHINPSKLNSFMKQVDSVLKPGGIFYLITPNAIFCGPAEKSGIHHSRHKFGHHKHYSRNELRYFFRKYGYVEMFSRFEDSGFRLKIKRVCLILSYLDRKFVENSMYRFVTWPFIWCANLVLSSLYPFVLLDDQIHRNDEFGTQTIAIAFKKLKS